MLSFTIHAENNVFKVRATTSIAPSDMMELLEQVVKHPEYSGSMGTVLEFDKGSDLIVMDWVRKTGIESIADSFFRSRVNTRVAVVLPGEPLTDNFVRLNYSFLEIGIAQITLFDDVDEATSWAADGAPVRSAMDPKTLSQTS